MNKRPCIQCGEHSLVISNEVHFCAPCSVACFLEIPATARGAAIVDLQNQIAAACEQLRLGIEAPIIMDVVWAAMNEHHHGARARSALWFR